MNVNSILGFIIASAVLFLGLRLASEDLGMFIDYPSMFIVVGGTFAATA
jgi:chemotaxis protein MotA